MKKRSFTAAIGCFIVIGTAVLLFSGQRPYRALKSADIVSAAVQLSPPDQTIPIPDTENLAAYLSKIVVCRKDNSHTEYAGQAAIFTLTMADGSLEEIVTYYPFVIINGTGYRTKYEPCAALSRYANSLLENAG